MPQSVIKQVDNMAINEYYDEDLILIDINWSTLEVYYYEVNTHDITVGVDNNYNNYNINDVAYSDGTNNKEDNTTYEYGARANTTHEDGTRYTPTTAIHSH